MSKHLKYTVTIAIIAVVTAISFLSQKLADYVLYASAIAIGIALAYNEHLLDKHQ